MTGFVIAAIAMLLGLIPCGIVILRGKLAEAVVAYQVVSAVAVMVLILLCQAFHRSDEFELAVILGVLFPGSGLVFARALERWL